MGGKRGERGKKINLRAPTNRSSKRGIEKIKGKILSTNYASVRSHLVAVDKIAKQKQQK